MAGDSNVNGNYGSHEGFTGNQPAPESVPSVAPDAEANTLSKEEIGWFFVEQYYKTLCNEPSKLYLYYAKRSQFLSGDEAEKVLVAVGQKAISERIKELDVQDCKVRVSNVDSQECLKNILVQVIGEMSNKAKPHRKFVQTFVLAEQTSGYYVLNDIFRYIAWEEDDYDATEEAIEAPKPDTTLSTDEPQKDETETDHKDEEPEEVTDHKVEEPKEVKVNGHTEPAVVEEPAKKEPVPETVTESPREDPTPAPVAASPQPPKAAPAPEPAKPAAPKTWASLVGRAAPAPATNGNVATPKPAQPKPKVAPMSKPSETQTNGTEWQMANQQRQSRPHSQSVSSSQANVLGYVKNVTEKVDASILKARLQTFGELAYFDVSRLKNCAFIEYADATAYNAAVAANPHEIGGEQIYVEERRPRANAYGGNTAQRGGMRGRGNEPFRNNQGRGGFNKENIRGGANNRGRGGAVPKARVGATQAA